MKATVAVLTFNGEEFLDEVLSACLSQETSFRSECLVVDSGSTDRTLEIVARYPGVRLHRIPNVEFGHGRTRNLAAGLAAGDIVVFLTQDATPVGTTWLSELVAPFEYDPTLAGVFARQVPRPGCGPTTSREVAGVFRDPPPGFFSNVCSAIRRDVLRAIPFRDVDYAEDRGFAADAAGAGLRTGYVPEAQVLHSHDLALGPYFRRMYDEAAGLRAVDPSSRTKPVLWLLAATARGTVLDWAFVATNRDYTFAGKVRHAARVPAYNVARRLAIWLAGRPLSARARSLLSLESQRRRVATS